MSNPNEWLHMYHHNFSNQSPMISDDEMNSGSAYGVSDAAAVTTAVTSATAVTASRVAKPVRRRSRASRRTPTTLLNTDAANFRAMVQQFTGGPSNSNAQNFTFGFGGSRPVVDPTAVVVPPGYHAPLFQYQNQQPPPFMFSLNDGHVNAPASEAFLQTHGGSRTMSYMDGGSHGHPRPS